MGLRLARASSSLCMLAWRGLAVVVSALVFSMQHTITLKPGAEETHNAVCATSTPTLCCCSRGIGGSWRVWQGWRMLTLVVVSHRMH
jgi:hypothetical protein